MQEPIPVFFQRLADAFLVGNHGWLAGIYTYPFVIYIEGEIALERTPDVTLGKLFERRGIALLAGTCSIRSDTLKIGKSVDGRFPVRVNWYFLDADGREITRNELRYFCRQTPGGEIRIESLEFIRRGFTLSGQVRRLSRQ